MPKRSDIESILIIGAGPIVIGQACEFDYSGAQACKALKDEGYRVILVNSNPATIMTDPGLADATYIEPITPEILAKVIERERPDALLPTMGGQTALNAGMQLAERGTLEAFGVEMIGATAEAIRKAEDRDLFRAAMKRIGIATPRSGIARSWEEAEAVLAEIGLPVIIRPSFTLGGTGGGIATTPEAFRDITLGGLSASPTNEVLIERSILGWKEYEMEVVRDSADNCIIVCSIENVDPMGIHTGDSITVAPALTLTDKEYQVLRSASIAVLREIGVDTGGSNVQFAINPKDGELMIIEMNPRVSRSSALASKATGFPIAKVAAKLAVGYTLDELQNDITRVTPASFEPTIDYVVTKMPRFTFEKFPGTDPVLTTSMKSVGEAMAIGRSFNESLQKALRSMETGLTGLDEVEIPGALDANGKPDLAVLSADLAIARPDRLLRATQALRLGMSAEDVAAVTFFDPWFLARIEEILEEEAQLRATGLPKTGKAFLALKKQGFSDARIATLCGRKEAEVTARRHDLEVRPVFKRIDTCAGEFPSATPYMYSCYEEAFAGPEGPQSSRCEADPSGREKIMILGGGPNRIGQGIEFDYCCVHAAYALSEAGYETIMVNCNPETVSTDYDTSDRLYFEPLTAEDVLEIARVEQSRGVLKGVIVQLGGQTPLKLAHALSEAGVPILGTSPNSIDLAEDRERFQKLLVELGLNQPENGTATTKAEALAIAERIGYPVLIRPSYVLGGRAMEIVHDADQLRGYIDTAVKVSGRNPVLIDNYLRNAVEVDVDAICDGRRVEIAGIMEHIEEAGIHSGDSACVLPPHSLTKNVVKRISNQAKQLAIALDVKGLMNVQFAVQNGEIFVLEVNPRASRTVPFVAKATGVAVAKIAAQVMAGASLDDFEMTAALHKHIAVKEAVFPFARFPGVDIVLGPEMRSTGEVMGIDSSFDRAFLKAQIACNADLPESGTIFISVRDHDKPAIAKIARDLDHLGYRVLATGGTAKHLNEAGIPTVTVNKVHQGSPHVVDAMTAGDVQLVINTTEGRKAIADSFALRRGALQCAIPYYTTVNGAVAALAAIKAMSKGPLEVAPLQSYFKGVF